MSGFHLFICGVWSPLRATVVLWTLQSPQFLLPVELQRAESTPAGLSDSPHRLLQWVLWSHGATQPPRLPVWLPNRTRAAASEGGGVPSLQSVSPWTPAPIFDCATSSDLAVCSCLSPAPCYKASVICSVKCRPQTEGQLKVRQQRHPVPPGPAAHRKQGCAGSLCLAPEPASASKRRR